MWQAEGVTSHHVPVRKERGVRYCNNETVSDMGLERPQSVTERAGCAGYLGSCEGRIASQRASGGASGAWIGQDRKRKGQIGFGTAAIGLRLWYLGRQMGKASPKIFSEIQNPHFRWACQIFLPSPKLRVPCNAATTFPPHCYYIATTWIAGHEQSHSRPRSHRRGIWPHPLDYQALDRAGELPS